MTLEEIGPRLLWRIDSFSTATLRKSSAFRYLNSDWQWEYVVDDSNNSLVHKSAVFLTRLSPFDDENQVKCFLSFVYVKTPDGKKTLEQMHTYDMVPRNRWLVFEIEKENIVRRGLVWKDGCIFSCSLEALGTYEQLASLEKELPTPTCLDSLSGDLKNLLDTSTMTDVILKCGDKCIPAHKCILSCRSPVFKAMFQNDFKESIQGTVDIVDVERTTFQKLIDYIYKGNFDSNEECVESVCNLFKAADKYCVQPLKHRCVTFLKENLDPSNACDILVMSHIYGQSDLKSCVVFYLATKRELLISEDWRIFANENLALAKDVFLQYLQISDLK